MKKLSFWTFLILLLAQQPAGASQIYNYQATLTGVDSQGNKLTGSGNFTYDPNPPLNVAPCFAMVMGACFAYKFTFNPSLDLSVAAAAQKGSSPKILSSSVTSIYILRPDGNASFQVFQLTPTQLNQQVTGYSTQDNNGQRFTSLTGDTVVPPSAGGIVLGALTASGCAPSDGECFDFLSKALPQSPPYDQACASIPGIAICGLITPAVPAPGSLPLFGIGIAGLYLLHQRRKPGQPILPAVAV